MYSCCSGICFLKPASTFSWLAKNTIAAVTSANTSSTSGRAPKTRFSLTLFRLIAAPLRPGGCCLLRVVGVRALVADDHEVAAPVRQDAGQGRRLARGVVERGE